MARTSARASAGERKSPTSGDEKNTRSSSADSAKSPSPVERVGRVVGGGGDVAGGGERPCGRYGAVWGWGACGRP
eukprot:scaffold5185_cov110-Isochrysis_galbana.AAC.1